MNIVGKKVFGPGDFSVGLANEFLAILGKKGFSPGMMRQVANTKSGKADEILRLFKEDLTGILVDWQNFYKKVFRIETDLLKVKIPQMRKGFNRLMVVEHGFTLQRLYDVCEQRFDCQKWTNESLDEVTDLEKPERKVDKGPYAIWVRDRVEADRELKNLSAIQIQEKNITTETFEERFLHELKFFEETGEHLDVENTTLCSGSRYSNGSVPSVHWCGGGFDIGYVRPSRAHSYLRAREVVS